LPICDKEDVGTFSPLQWVTWLWEKVPG
jgi:hypothetical protein